MLRRQNLALIWIILLVQLAILAGHWLISKGRESSPRPGAVVEAIAARPAPAWSKPKVELQNLDPKTAPSGLQLASLEVESALMKVADLSLNQLPPPPPGQVPPPIPAPGKQDLGPPPLDPPSVPEIRKDQEKSPLVPQNPFPYPLVTNSKPPLASPWSFHLEVVEGKNRLTAKAGTKVTFQVWCDEIKLESPQAGLHAKGNVKLADANVEASCGQLTIPLDKDQIILEGNAIVRFKNEGQNLELRGERLQVRLQNLPKITEKSPTP